MAFIALGVTGGIGAYKSVEVVRLLQKRGHRVQAVLTRSARRFVGPLTFEAITREPVITSLFTPGSNAAIEHIALATNADLLVVAPATADSLARFAHGLADDFLAALYLATRAPVLVAPAMNTNMWEHAAVRANIETLRARGVHFVEPGQGYLACGWVGTGRLAEPDAIVEAAERLLASRRSLAGRKVLVTAGPTVEDLDPVRFISNRSSGRMGAAIAAVARERGADVLLVAGPVSVPLPAVSELVQIRSAQQMRDAVLSRAAEMDVVIMAAAVADFSPAVPPLTSKIEKTEMLTVELRRTEDILGALGRHRGANGRPLLVGFAAQTGDPIDAARRKLTTKQADLIVANDVTAPGAGFEVDTNQVVMVTEATTEALPLMSKVDVAAAILDRVEVMLAASSTAVLSR